MPHYVNKRFSIYDVIPGMEVGKVVLTENGQVALSEGTVLNFSLIERLKYWGVNSLEIREVIPDNDSAPQIPDSSQQKFYNGYNSTVNTIKRAFENMRYFKEVPLQEMSELVEKSVNPLVEAVGVINHLHLVRRQDDYTFHHSVNVAVICGVLGKWLGYNGVELKDLILAGLIHDVGKTQIPLEILNKPGRLTDEEMDLMRQHTTFGYNMVKDLNNLPLHIIYAVLQHHERMDGSGYPFKVRGNKIHPYARIVAVADIYDAMTSDRVYHDKSTPFTVVEMLVGEMFHKLDPSICTVFLNNVRDYFAGSRVRLSDGREAEVVYLGQFSAARPIVRTDDGEFIDLEKRKDISIASLGEESA
ncbi:MAG: HD-GYP domain-containing protein [Pelosinus sp.]|nr:HD-GYP domain-containing protein [Pelosinus sp.]